LFQHLGGFDEGYERAYFEDADLCLRAREAGARIRYQPTCTLLHSVGSTGGSPYFMKNARRFKQTWIDSGKVKAGTLTPTARYW
jgi:GT2 family glycosyltransferase